MFRWDLIYGSIFRCFRPYAVAGGLTVIAALVQFEVAGYGQLQGAGNGAVALHLAANIAAAGLTIVAMRSVGMFCRHYWCYLRWM